MNYIIATIKPWNISNFKKHFSKKNNFFLINKKEDLTLERLKKINPEYIFFPHWSWIIPEKIWSNYQVVVFHMTDLPYGRGGTPLQNLILRGHTKTKISAIKVNGGLDTGDIYFKNSLSLRGSASEIYQRMSDIIFSKMIPNIIAKKYILKKQTGRVTIFKRRNPEESLLPENFDLKKMYDFIRMLDAKTYPKAYLDRGNFRFEFSKAKIKGKKLITNVTIYEK